MVALWQDFVTQAKTDLRRAQIAYDAQDYGAAAEDSQHAIEVYLKAYLMRYELISNPGEVNHMKLVSVLLRIQTKAESIVTKFSKTRKFIVPMGKAKVAMKGLAEILRDLQPKSGDLDSEDMKMKLSLWKYSLGIVGPDYERNFRQINDQLKMLLKPMLDEFLEYYQKAIVPILDTITLAQKEEAAEKYVKDSGFHSEIISAVIRGDTPKIRPEDAYVYMIVFLMFLEKLFKDEVRHQPEQWQFYKDSKEVYMLTYPFRFFDTLINTYPHQDIGRYPNYVDGQSTIDLYKQYAPQLGNLMTRVLDDCKKIDNAINGRWNLA